jgi:transposase-like protein/sulfur carrier protein ThiS
LADEEGVRKDAIRRYLQGDGAAAIATELGRSQRWVFKWLSRYEEGASEWFKSESRAPTARSDQRSEETASLILAARDRLENDPRLQRGAAAITWQLASMGVAPDELPGRWTIERVLKAAGRSKPRQRTKDRYVPKGTPYPFRPSRVGAGGLHEVDSVGPRYLDGGIEVHSLNVMDVGSHRVGLEPLAHPTPKAYAGHLLHVWERLGLPEVAQFDNHPSFRGDIGNGRVFGPVVRLCLALGVVVRYVPLKEPWRNGAIEHFNDVFDKSFFRTERFSDLPHMRRRGADFEVLHNATHHYSTLRGRTPDVAWADAKILAPQPPANFVIPQKLPRRGRVEVVRFIRSDQDLNLFGEHIQLPEQTVYQYVVATISIRTQQLVVTCAGEIVHEASHEIR